MAAKRIVLFVLVVGSILCSDAARLAVPAVAAWQPANHRATRLPTTILLELRSSLSAPGTPTEKGNWPALRLLCATESFSAKVAAVCGSDREAELALSIAGTVEVVQPGRVFLSYVVSAETTDRHSGAQEKYDIQGSAIVSSGKPAVIFTFGKRSLILVATFVEGTLPG